MEEDNDSAVLLPGMIIPGLELLDGVVEVARYLHGQRTEIQRLGEFAVGDLAELAGSGSGYAVLAGLREGALRAKEGDIAGAVAAYKRIADDDGIDANFRQLATLLAVLHGLDSEEPAAMIARLERAKAALKRAEERLAAAKEEIDFVRAQAALQRAILRIQMAESPRI